MSGSPTGATPGTLGCSRYPRNSGLRTNGWFVPWVIDRVRPLCGYPHSGHNRPPKDLLKCGRWPVEMGYSITRYARSNPGCVILNRPIWDTIGVVRGSGEFRRAIVAGQRALQISWQN